MSTERLFKVSFEFDVYTLAIDETCARYAAARGMRDEAENGRTDVKEITSVNEVPAEYLDSFPWTDGDDTDETIEQILTGGR